MKKETQKDEKILDVNIEVSKVDDGMLFFAIKSPQVPKYSYSGLFKEDLVWTGASDLLRGAMAKFIRVVLHGAK